MSDTTNPPRFDPEQARQEIERVREYEEKTTKGPWPDPQRVGKGCFPLESSGLGTEQREANYTLCANARHDLPLLCSLLAAATDEVARLRADITKAMDCRNLCNTQRAEVIQQNAALRERVKELEGERAGACERT